MRKILLLTANVGSLFENDCKLHQPWMDAIVQKFELECPEFAVVHMQETGGKKYVECAWQAPKLVEELSRRLKEYPIIKAYLDIEHQVPTFTALGTIVFVRESSVDVVSQFDFVSRTYSKMGKGLEILTEGLENNAKVVKRKFPREFWPAIKWGRKGYMHSRWRVNNRTFDCVNVHLFHDESNLALIHENPSLYSANRKRALEYVLEQMKSEENGCLPLLFIFGDLNFRLDCPSFLTRLTERSAPYALNEMDEQNESTPALKADSLEPHTDPLRRTVSAIEFRRLSKVDVLPEGCVLRIEKKRFDYFDHKMLLDDWKAYLDDDKETKAFTQLKELPVDFPPTYPWSEDPNSCDTLMKTRAPAWCDRVLMNEYAHAMVLQGNPTYLSIGATVCTGDHKPVALSFMA